MHFLINVCHPGSCCLVPDEKHLRIHKIQILSFSFLNIEIRFQYGIIRSNNKLMR